MPRAKKGSKLGKKSTGKMSKKRQSGAVLHEIGKNQSQGEMEFEDKGY